MILHLAIRRGLLGHAITGAPWPHHEVVDLGSGACNEERIERLMRRALAFGPLTAVHLDSTSGALDLIVSETCARIGPGLAFVDSQAAWHLDGLTARNEAEAVALGMAAYAVKKPELMEVGR